MIGLNKNSLADSFSVELSDDLNDKVTAIGPDSTAGDCRFYLYVCPLLLLLMVSLLPC